MRPLALALVAWAAAGAASAASVVRVAVSDLRMTHAGELQVTLESADGRAHRVELRVSDERGGLRPLPATVDVPAAGSVRAALRVFRGDAAWDTRREVDVVALEGEVPVDLASATIDVAADPALVPRLRPWLIALGLVLLGLALVRQWRQETTR